MVEDHFVLLESQKLKANFKMNSNTIDKHIRAGSNCLIYIFNCKDSRCCEVVSVNATLFGSHLS